MRTLLWSMLWLVSMAAATTASTIFPNDNARPSGRLDGSVLTVRLFAGIGSAQPAGPRSVPIEVAAFGEEGGNLSAPGPLVRVREGTTIVITLRNTLGSALTVHGLCARPGPCDPVSVASGASQEIRFELNAPGTYFYWAATSSRPLRARAAHDTQLGGAIVVDPREGSPVDRVFVISTFGGTPPPPKVRASESDVFAINGLSWPHTEQLHYKIGDRVRWRIINLSFTSHPMHLHGFYFVVEATGDISTAQPLAPDQQRMGVTEYVNVGRTFVMSWTPETPGKWLFHCHMTPHMSGPEHTAHYGHGGNDSAAGMAGLVLGIHVTGDWKAEPSDGRVPRKFSMVMREEPNRYGKQNGYRVDLEGVDAPRINPGPVPGPVLVLTRGEPVEITLVNRMSEPTAIHWHGIELENYYDGVPGWGKRPGAITPAIDPGQSFVAKFTPPRAGTFIYHTHWHKDLQLTGGLYGALIVVEPGERYDPETDHIFIISLDGIVKETEPEPIVLNGSTTPEPVVMRAGVPNRLRLINITAYDSALSASLFNRFDQTTWKPVAKDGATLPPQQTAVRPAHQLVSVGETYDFEVQPSLEQTLWLEVRRATGKWVTQAPIRIH
ncbi:multicopper oxidase domain-containing protein [Bradyrhizobium sp. Arg68]|uniref:multicopper oxidase domain-containing protein n=1 Tax=Bradyrhizobium ivorense TaxID=2511166 RepID=UPI001E6205F9|nr:multicopper oxidase domain-containing protein [Bradyrhizobium ivorense]MCC8940784.1 multicopper oxidase domain-containing protein [Bradyrhizobium ivorense]